MKPTDNYAYSFDNEHYYGQHDSIREALRLAKEDIKYNDELINIKTIYIGRVYKYEPCVDAVRVIECVQQDAYDEADEYSEDYLDNVKEEEWQKLEAMLTETFNKWAKETGNEPDFFVVKDVVEYSLEGVDAAIEVVKEQTPIDTAKHGHWIFAEDMVSYIKCSECGDDICWVNTKRPKYCPNCGARMDGKEE